MRPSIRPRVLSRCSRVQATLSDAGKPAVTFRHTRHSRPSWKGAAEPSPKSLQRAPLAGASRDAHPAESALKRQTAGPEMRLQTSLEHRLRARLPLRPCSPPSLSLSPNRGRDQRKIRTFLGEKALEGVRSVLRGLSAPRSSAAGLCVFAETGPPALSHARPPAYGHLS